MALASKLSRETIELEHEPGQSITIRPVSWLVMREARDARVKRAIKPFADLPPESIAALQRPNRNGPNPTDSAEDDEPTDVYDRETLLRASIVEWTYEDPVTNDNIGDLDEVTAEVVYRRAVALNTRSKSEGEA